MKNIIFILALAATLGLSACGNTNDDIKDNTTEQNTESDKNNIIDDAGDAVKDIGDGVSDGISDVSDGVGNGVKDMSKEQ